MEKAKPITKSRRRPKRAFITALAHQNLDTLKKELTRRGIEVLTAHDLTFATGILVVNIEEVIKKADIVIAVIPEQPSANLFFELGLARGLGKPVLLLISPEYKGLPSYLEPSFYLRVDPHDSEAIGFALDQYMARPHRPSLRPRKPPKEGRPLGDDADRFLARIRQEGDNLSGHELEGLVIEVLQRAGVKVVSQSPRPDLRGDIAIWSDALQPLTGNPLLIEVKSRLRSDEEVFNTLAQLEQYRVESGARLALLIVNVLTGGLPMSTRMTSMPAMVGGVLAITLSDFIERLRHETFADAIGGLRNQLVHSGRK